MCIKQPAEVSFWVDQLGVCVDERTGARPQGRKGASVVKNVHIEAVFHVVITHEAENVIVNVAEEVNLD